MKNSSSTPEISSLELMREINHRVPEVEIRDYQLEALDAIADNERQGRDASLLVMAPGLGKTTVMAADFRRRLLKDPQARGLFLNDNNDILNQAHERFQSIVGDEFEYGLFSGDGRDYDEVSVLFGSFQVMRKWHIAFMKDEFKFGAVDEGHHAKADTYEPTLNYFDFEHLLGVTATPDRMDVKDIRDIFGQEVFSMTLEAAIRQRLLANVDYHIITDEVVEERRLIDDYGEEYPFAQLDRKIFVPKRDDEIARIIHEKAENIENVKRIIFCSSIEDAENFSGYFENSTAYHSDLTRTERKRRLNSFKTPGGIETICAVDAFNEGIDVPYATQLVFKRQTASKRIYLQQLGRGLRRTGAKSRVQVLDFVGNAERLLMVDRIWQDSGALIDPDEELLQTIEIDMSFVHFSEQAKRILPLLKRIASGVYLEGQTVPLGATRLSRLAGELDMTPAALKSVATYLKIDPELFPTKKGSKIPYFKHEDAERIRRASSTIFQKRRK